MSHHPDAETIAEYQAGALAPWRVLRRRRIAAHLARCQECASVSRRLSAVTAVLAATPALAMPIDVAERLTVVLAAQPSPAHSPTTHGRSRRLLTAPGGRQPWLVPVGVVVVLGLLGVGGFALSQGQGHGTSGISSGTLRGTAGASGSPIAGNGIEISPEHVGGPRATPGGQTGYRVVASGTDYLPATLRVQVSGEMADNGLNAAIPPSALAGCVAKIRAGSVVRFVDLAKYQGRQAWVIASTGRAWVTGTMCSATMADLLATVALATS